MYTKQDLEGMTIRQLRLIDVKTIQEEQMLQEVLNTKLSLRNPQVAINRSDAPEIKTPEEEAAYQKIIDARTARIKNRMFGSGSPQAPLDDSPPVDDVSTVPPSESASDEELVDHVLTEEDLEENPDLVEDGMVVGDTVKIPKVDETKVADEGEQTEDDPDSKDGAQTGFCPECNSKRKGKHKKSCSLFVE